jgi:hypothetical protein
MDQRQQLLQKLSLFNINARALTQQQQETINQVIEYLEKTTTKGAQDDGHKRSI